MAHQRVLFPVNVRRKSYDKKLFKFCTCLLDSFSVCRVNNINQCISVGKVVAPIFSERFLSSDIPNVELELIMGKVLDVEALSWCNGANILRVFEKELLRWREPSKWWFYRRYPSPRQEFSIIIFSFFSSFSKFQSILLPVCYSCYLGLFLNFYKY